MIYGILLGLIIASIFTFLANWNDQDVPHQLTDRSWYVVHANKRIQSILCNIAAWIFLGSAGGLIGLMI